MSVQTISIVLFLGSYDSDTKLLMDNAKEEIAKIHSGNVFAVVLDSVEIYNTGNYNTLVEFWDKKQATLFLFKDGLLHDVYDAQINRGSTESQEILEFLKEKIEADRIKKFSIANKFGFLMKFAKEIIVLRSKEETKGGEYIELMHALYERHSEKIWFFLKEGIKLSLMVPEYLDKYRVKMRFFKDPQELNASIVRILSYLEK